MPHERSFPDRAALTERQTRQWDHLWREVMAGNRFYQAKFSGISPRAPDESLVQSFPRLPLTEKSELVADQSAEPPYGSRLTYPVERYTRFHQTSGSTGAPLRWLDTPESWDWMLGNWLEVHRAAGVLAQDRMFFAFSFGPFLGFWTAFESAAQLGCLCLPGGGLSSAARLRLLLDNAATILCCTPTYAVRLAEVAQAEKIDLRQSKIRLIHVAGEPGGSIPAMRAQLEDLWPGARVFDHHGMTEVGPVSFQCPAEPGVLHIIESSYVAEVIDPATQLPVTPGNVGELVLTTLGRVGSPLIRYRTGDLVCPRPPGVCTCGRSDLALAGGILSRTDDMVVVRGVNIYPSALHQLIQECGGIAEYQATVHHAGGLAELEVQIEPAADVQDTAALVQRLERIFETSLALRLSVRAMPAHSLPRFEAKARRWHRA